MPEEPGSSSSARRAQTCVENRALPKAAPKNRKRGRRGIAGQLTGSPLLPLSLFAVFVNFDFTLMYSIHSVKNA